MPYDRIAIYGYRGWARSAIADALMASGAPVTVLHRASSDSDTSCIPLGVRKIQVDVDDHEALIAALQDIDIVISLVAFEGIKRQHALVKAIPHTNFQLFSPSDLAARHDEERLEISVNKAKGSVEKAAKEAGSVASLVIELREAKVVTRYRAMGVDIKGNKIIFTGDSAKHRLNLCTRSYVGAAYAAIFAETPVSQLRNRTMCFTGLSPTGEEKAAALEEKNGATAKVLKHSLEKFDSEISDCLRSGSLFALSWYCCKIWGNGKQAGMVGSDVWDVNIVAAVNSASESS